jgi:antirestriction factor ArdC-like protein
MKSEQIKAITEKATEQLIAALDAGHSETLNAYLKAIGRFHRYSLHNVMLIALQKPNASHVAGFRTWNQLGRYNQKRREAFEASGFEKGLDVLAGVTP